MGAQVPRECLLERGMEGEGLNTCFGAEIPTKGFSGPEIKKKGTHRKFRGGKSTRKKPSPQIRNKFFCF